MLCYIPNHYISFVLLFTIFSCNATKIHGWVILQLLALLCPLLLSHLIQPIKKKSLFPLLYEGDIKLGNVLCVFVIKCKLSCSKKRKEKKKSYFYTKWHQNQHIIWDGEKNGIQIQNIEYIFIGLTRSQFKII